MSSGTRKGHRAAVERRPADSMEPKRDLRDPEAAVPGDPSALTGHFEAFVGPLPHPDHYAAYEHTLNGAADRILGLAERQSAHRQAQEALELRAGLEARTRGQWFAFLIAIVSLGLGAYLAASGMSLVGGVVLFVALAELAIAIYAKLRHLLGPSEPVTRRPDDAPAPPIPGPSRRSHPP